MDDNAMIYRPLIYFTNHYSLASRLARSAKTVRDPCIATPHSDLGQRTRSQNGPQPIHDVVVSAVIAAVAAATITFNSTSQKREFFIPS